MLFFFDFFEFFDCNQSPMLRVYIGIIRVIFRSRSQQAAAFGKARLALKFLTFLTTPETKDIPKPISVCELETHFFILMMHVS